MSNLSRTVIAADNSQIKLFTECPRKWYYSQVLNLRKKGPQKKALDRGTIAHSLLDFYYKHIPTCEGNRYESYKYSISTFEKAYKQGQIITDLSKEEIKFIAERFFHYYSLYTVIGDYTPAVIAGKPLVEQGFSIPLVDNEHFLFVLEGKIDLITDQWFFVDHKTQQRKYEHYSHDPQWKTYGLATGCTKVVVNYYGTQKDISKDTFRRQAYPLASDSLHQYREYLIKIFYRMAHAMSTNTFEQEFTSCAGSWGYPCEYHEIDEMVNKKSQLLTIEAHYTSENERWEPWKLEEVK